MDINKTTRIIDNLIYVFIIIFLLSLTNSIFVNQIGYYGSLLLLLLRYFITKENRFRKSGLEFAFVWFIVAEIISGFLSVNQAYSFNNLLKRVLLIPVVYVIIAGVTDFKRGKNFFFVYIAASLVTSVIYIYFAFKALTENIYRLEGIGVSLFHHSITASEIISFSVVFLFAFLINEKVNWKYKLLILIAFGISFASLISTYKRTGWIGAVLGIFIILLIKKEWRILIPGVILLIVIIAVQKDVSEVKILEYNKNQSELNVINSFSTDGRASHIFPLKNSYILSDYENGLVFYEDTTVVNKMELPAPVVSFSKWEENYYIAYLIDTRFILIEKEKEETWIVRNEFVSPGFTVDWKIYNNCLYVLDKDSGLTIFKDPKNVAESIRYPELKNYNLLYADTGHIVFISAKKQITIYNMVNNEPEKIILDSVLNRNVTSVFYYDNKLLLSNNQKLNLFGVGDNILVLLDSVPIPPIYNWVKTEEKLFAIGFPSILYELNIKDNILIQSQINLNFFPNFFTYNDGKVFITRVERSKLNSIWDPYLPSNFVRLSLWRVGWEIFKDHPFFGVGDISMGNYQIKYRKYYEKELHGHLHNNFVHILAALGLFGLFAVLFMLLKMYLINFDIYKKNKDVKFLSSYSLGTIGVLTAFIISGLTELNIWDHEIITLVYFTFALNIALGYLGKNN